MSLNIKSEFELMMNIVTELGYLQTISQAC